MDWIKTSKGFKVLPMTAAQTTLLGGAGICDFCNGQNGATKGFYVAVLHSWYCEKCYHDWHKRARFYPEDSSVEMNNVERVSAILNIEFQE